MHHLHVRRFFDITGALNRKTRMVRFLCPGCRKPTDKVLADVASALKKNPRVYCSLECSKVAVTSGYDNTRKTNLNREFFVDTAPHTANIGHAGELLVAADLTTKGITVAFAPPSCVFDLVAYVGNQLFRIQVKTASGHRAALQGNLADTSYKFKICKSVMKSKSPTGQPSYKRYDDSDFDILALVGLDTHNVAYIGTKPILDTYKLYPNSYMEFSAKPVLRFNNFTWSTATRTRLGL